MRYLILAFTLLTSFAATPLLTLQFNTNGLVVAPVGLTQTNDTLIATNNLGGKILIDSATQKVELTNIFNKLDIRSFGAVEGDTNVNNAVFINAALLASYNGSAFPKSVYIPEGRWYISSPIIKTNNGHYGHLIGNGIRSTWITATAAMPHMIDTGDTGNTFDGRSLYTGITWDANNLATNIFEGSTLAYSWIVYNEFVNVKTNGWAILIGKNNNLVAHNIINGGGVGNGILGSGTPFNNFLIQENALTDVGIGIQLGLGAQDFHIRGNSIDRANKVAIALTAGAMSGTIYGNYIEGRGTNGFNVQVHASTNQTWHGSIILHGLYNALSATLFENITIKHNTFANVYTNIMSLANLSSVRIEDNHIYTGYSYTNFVDLRWTGSPYTHAKENYIEYVSTVGATVHHPVGLNVDDVQQNTAGMRIKLNDRVAYSKFSTLGEILGNPMNWQQFGTTGTLSIGRSGKFETVWQIWQLERSAGSDQYKYKIIDIDTNIMSSLSGPRYLRLQYATKGGTGTTNGLQVTVFVDGVQKSISTRTSDTWRVAENMLIYIPSGSTNMQIAFTPVTSGIPCQVTKFSVTEAHLPFDDAVSLTDLRYHPTALPSYATWVTGDADFLAAPVSNYVGWVTTLSGTPGTQKFWGPTEDLMNAKLDEVGGTGTNMIFYGITSIGGFTNTLSTPNRVAVWDSASRITNSANVDPTEIEYVDGVTAPIQTQINNRQPLDSDLTTIANNNPGNSYYFGTDGTGVKGFYTFPGATTITNHTTIAVGDLTTAITTGNGKAYWRAPAALTMKYVRASLLTASSGGDVTLDVNEAGTTIFSTRPTIDVSETSTTTAAVPSVLSDTAIADDALITIDIDVSGTNAAGLQVRFYYTIP